MVIFCVVGVERGAGSKRFGRIDNEMTPLYIHAVSNLSRLIFNRFYML